MTNPLEKNGKPIIDVIKIHTQADFQQAIKIRYAVFVQEQKVPIEEEIDDFENQSIHFIAYKNKIPCGTARWRVAEKGIKLERFAVLQNHRGKGVGSALVDAVLNDIDSNSETHGKQMYLFAQLSAMKLYSHFGFQKVGILFQECNIDHYKMVRS